MLVEWAMLKDERLDILRLLLVAVSNRVCVCVCDLLWPVSGANVVVALLFIGCC